jgi:dUTPase
VKIKTKTMRAITAETEMETEQGRITIMKNIDIPNARINTHPENPLESTTDIAVLVETGIAAQVEAGTEFLVAIPAKKGSKMYTTYLGLIDSGASGSLMNK